MFRQFLTRFSRSDWFLDVLKVSTEHGSRVQCQVPLETVNKIKQHGAGNRFFSMVTYLLPLRTSDLPGLAPKSVKHNFRNS